MQPRVLVLRAPGTNCDHETVFAFQMAGAVAERVHINRVIESPELLGQFDILCLAGGFSYGDDLGAGRILAKQVQLHLADALQDFRTQGKLILGICNGFQVLLESGLLLSDSDPPIAAALGFNQSAKFEDRWVQLQVESDRCVFLKGIEQLYLPVAHAEGQVVLEHPDQLDCLREHRQIALTYRSQRGASEPEYPDNPNGSIGHIAGLCDRSGRILGLMPHPERFVHATQHPRWTREQLPEEGDGLAIFRNAVDFFR